MFGHGAIVDQLRRRQVLETDPERLEQGDVVRPLDMNTAEAIDLESVLQLLRRESKVVLDCRAKRGQFTSLDDLKSLDRARSAGSARFIAT